MEYSAPCYFTLRLHVFHRQFWIKIFCSELLSCFRIASTHQCVNGLEGEQKLIKFDRCLFKDKVKPGQRWCQVHTSDRTHHGCVLGLGLSLSLSNLLLVHGLHHHLLLLLEQSLLLELEGLLHSLLVLRKIVRRFKNISY